MYKWPLDFIFKSRDHLQKYIITMQFVLAVVAFSTYGANAWFISLSFLWYLVMLHVGHNAGLHRYFSHSSYKLSKPWHIFITFISTLVAFGSPLGYAIIHKTHHRYSDTPDDPHQPKKPVKTFFFMFNSSDEKISPLYARGLRDYWISFTHSYYLLILVTFYIALLAIDPIVALSYNVGICGILLGTGWVNVVNHTSNFLSYRNFQTKDKSNNDLVAGYLLGEWHNNHHANPTSYTQKVKWWELDIPTFIIKSIKNED